MHPSAGGPPVVVENFIAEANHHRSRIISTPSYCDGDQGNSQKRLEQLAPITFLGVLQTLPALSRTGAASIDAHVQRADIVHAYALESLERFGTVRVSPAHAALPAHAPRYARS